MDWEERLKVDWIQKTVDDFLADPESAKAFGAEDAGRLKAFVRWIDRNRMFDAELDMFGTPINLNSEDSGAEPERRAMPEKEDESEKQEGNDGGGEAAEAGEGEVRPEVHPGGVP